MCLAVAPASAALTTAPGTSAAAFLDLGFGARAAAMADAFVSVADDAAAAHYNPAGLAYPAVVVAPSPAGRPYEMLVGQSMLVQGVQMTQVALARRPWGFSFSRVSYGDIEARTSETAAPDGGVAASDMAIGFSGATKVAGFGLGATGKLVQQTIGANSATALAVDLGALKRFDGTRWSAGADLANFGSKVRFVDQASPLPTTLRLGGTYGLTKDFPHALTFELDLPRDDSPTVRLGAEYAGFGPLSLRIGYASTSSAQRNAALGKSLGTTASGLSDFYGMTMGAGLRTPYGEFSYAIVPYGELGTAQRLAYGYSFGGKK